MNKFEIDMTFHRAEKELDKMAQATDRLEMLDKHFGA